MFNPVNTNFSFPILNSPVSAELQVNADKTFTFRVFALKPDN